MERSEGYGNGNSDSGLAAETAYAGSGQDYVFDYEAWGRGDSVDPSGSGSAFDPEDEKERIDPGRGAGCGALLCNVILKPLVARIRPYDVNTAVQLLVSKPVDYSFPTGHTAASFASVVALFMAGERKLWKTALVLAVLIAFSRLYLYVHYPTDVLGGLILGLIAGYLGSRLILWLMAKRENCRAAA